MVKTNKKSVVALIVMALLLVASLVLGATGAWFTHSVTDNGSLTFGNIEISATELTVVASGVDGKTETTAMLMPDDTLEIDFSVTNNYNAAWVLADVKIELVGADSISGTAKDAITGLSGQYISTINDATKSSTKATNEAEGYYSHVEGDTGYNATADTKDYHIELHLAGADYGNEWKNVTINVTVTVYAIQQENLLASDAYGMIMDTIEAEDGYIDFETGLAYVADNQGDN